MSEALFWRTSFHLTVEHEVVVCESPENSPELDSGQIWTLNDDSNEWGNNDLVCSGWFPYRLRETDSRAGG